MTTKAAERRAMHGTGKAYWRRLGAEIRRDKWLYILLIPAFFIGFCFLYNPFGMHEYFQTGGMTFGFHFLMLAVILMAILALTRLIFSAVYKHIPFRWWHYTVWCIGETFVFTLFMGMYATLFGKPGYFSVLSNCFKFSYLILIYPYLFLILLQIILNKEKDLNTEPSDTLVKFYDEHKRLKLTIAPTAILFIRADAEEQHSPQGCAACNKLDCPSRKF